MPQTGMCHRWRDTEARYCSIFQVMDASGSGSYSVIIQGMQWVHDYVTANNIQGAVVTLSVGGERSTSMNAAVDDLAAVSITQASNTCKCDCGNCDCGISPD